jgi:hypothetical protein
MANDIGSQTGIGGTSTALNTQAGAGGQKPSAQGNSNPGNTKPPRATDGKVQMPK